MRLSVAMMIARKFHNGSAHQGFPVTSQPTCKISANYLWICQIWNLLSEQHGLLQITCLLVVKLSAVIIAN